MKIGKRNLFILAAVVPLSAALIGVTELRGKPVAKEERAACCIKNAQAAQAESDTLDPKLFVGKVREAYKVAGEKPELLAQMYCYCGCDKTEGHRSLLDCFRDKHGSHCDICVGEALDSNRMFNQGAPPEQIRDALRARYSKRGE
jgi:hypothetical protein